MLPSLGFFSRDPFLDVFSHLIEPGRIARSKEVFTLIPRLLSVVTFGAISLGSTDPAWAQENNKEPESPSYNFQSCKVAKAYKERYESLGIRSPDSFYACDPRTDELEDSLAPYKNFDEAYRQWSKDVKNNPEAKISDYSYPKPYVLSKDELARVIEWAVLKSEPDVYTSLGANDVGVIFFYKDSIKWVGKDVVSLWYLVSLFHSRPLDVFFRYSSIKNQVAFNCRRGSYADLSQTVYAVPRANGGEYRQLLKKNLDEVKFFDIPPNSIYSSLHKKYCSGLKKK